MGRRSRGGVYVIANTQNGHLYVASAADMRAAWEAHRGCLVMNRHPRRSLQRAWNKYGSAAFVCFCVEEVNEVSLLPEAEDRWRKQLHPMYNAPRPFVRSRCRREQYKEDLRPRNHCVPVASYGLYPIQAQRGMEPPILLEYWRSFQKILRNRHAD